MMNGFRWSTVEAVMSPSSDAVLVVTTNDLPGYRIDEVFGEVFGLTVRSRNAFSQMGAGLKSMFGGELKGMTKALVDSRNEVMERMIAEARRAVRTRSSQCGSTRPRWARCGQRSARMAPPYVSPGSDQQSPPSTNWWQLYRDDYSVPAGVLLASVSSTRDVPQAQV